MYLSEQQRLEAIRACEGIEAANAKIQQAFKNILEIFEREARRSGDRTHIAAPEEVA